MATHDTLTGLYNKDYFSVKVAEVLKEKTDEDWLLVCSNIKDFKLINDLFGIEKGNEVLKMQADIFKEQCSEGVIPVSYTHLDVYKRQVQMRQRQLPCPFRQKPTDLRLQVNMMTTQA